VSANPDKDLVARCREGNDEAWRELVDRFGPRVYAIAYHFTMKREDAEELSQEIFLKVFENLHRYDGGFPLVAWILSVSRNLCIDRYRRRKREKSFRFVSDEAVTTLLKSEDDPAGMALKKERTKILFSALAEIPEDLAEILVLRDLNGLAYDEIGKALDLPEGTVKSRLFRARAEVARKIRERHESRGASTFASIAIAAAGIV
jgi:RNA polymerase sigma-70 factor, ECF subfamily